MSRPPSRLRREHAEGWPSLVILPGHRGRESESDRAEPFPRAPFRRSQEYRDNRVSREQFVELPAPPEIRGADRGTIEESGPRASPPNLSTRYGPGSADTCPRPPASGASRPSPTRGHGVVVRGGGRTTRHPPVRIATLEHLGECPGAGWCLTACPSGPACFDPTSAAFSPLPSDASRIDRRRRGGRALWGGAPAKEPRRAGQPGTLVKRPPPVACRRPGVYGRDRSPVSLLPLVGAYRGSASPGQRVAGDEPSGPDPAQASEERLRPDRRLFGSAGARPPLILAARESSHSNHAIIAPTPEVVGGGHSPGSQEGTQKGKMDAPCPPRPPTYRSDCARRLEPLHSSLTDSGAIGRDRGAW